MSLVQGSKGAGAQTLMDECLVEVLFCEFDGRVLGGTHAGGGAALQD